MINATTKDNNVQALKNNASEAIRDTSEDIRVTANRVGRRVHDFINNASDEVSHAGEKVTTEIRANPVRSSMVALGAGLVLGMFLRR